MDEEKPPVKEKVIAGGHIDGVHIAGEHIDGGRIPHTSTLSGPMMYMG